MKYYGLKLRPMQESGAFLLRAMQNEDMPRLDLLVRESVQNSLDAAIEQQPGSEIKVAFRLRAHTTETIASILSEGVDRDVLLARYPTGGEMLEIRDSMTEGLTGPMGFDDIGADGVHGNLLKLVYEIGRTRGDAAAGGSWGLGKTCYFRVGVGLVIYYSRIKTREGHEERLVASLVEDENRTDKMQQETRTGIGWWGAGEGLTPVTGPTQIKRILEMLRVERFTGTETGTSIIIPFLRRDLIDSAESDDVTGSASRPWWYDSYDDYIRVALERWFCARLDNPHFATGPTLTASVNGKIITTDRMLPVFRATQALYNRAVGAPIGPDDYLTKMEVAADAINNSPVEPRRLFFPSGAAGDLAAALLTPDQLGMGAPANHHDPAMCVFGRSGAKPPYHPLVTFMRRPGMCVAWNDSTDSRSWAGGMPGVADGRYLLAVFVPRQERVLANAGGRSTYPRITLESYLRGCERADHAAWHDATGMRIVEKIQSNCGGILRKFGAAPPPEAAIAHSIRMARNLADLVLPERGLGKDGRFGRPSPGRPVKGGSGGAGGIGGGRGAAVTPVLEVLGVDYTEKGVQVHWALVWGQGDEGMARKICVRIDSESGPISMHQWHDDGLGAFPFRVTGVVITGDKGGSSEAAVELSTDCDDGVVLRASAGTPSMPITGGLLIEVRSGEVGTLRPVLSVILLELVGEEA